MSIRLPMRCHHPPKIFCDYLMHGIPLVGVIDAPRNAFKEQFMKEVMERE